MSLTVEPLSATDLDVLEPLWSALREHHGAVAPHLGAVREREASWVIRRALYAEWLARDDSFALLARLDAEPVGYAMVVVNGPLATWPGERTGCLETLSVLPSARGAGVGSRLIAEARAGLAADGVSAMTIDVVSSNADALRFYARHGFGPCVTSLVGSTAPDG